MTDFDAMNRRAQAQYGAVSGDQQSVDLNMQLMEQQFFFDQSQAAQQAQWAQQHGEGEGLGGVQGVKQFLVGVALLVSIGLAWKFFSWVF